MRMRKFLVAWHWMDPWVVIARLIWTYTAVIALVLVLAVTGCLGTDDTINLGKNRDFTEEVRNSWDD